MKLKINGLIEKPRWYNINCSCGNKVMDKYPIKDCLHCKFEAQEKSMPRETFKIKNTKNKEVSIKEITIVRGEKYQDIIGWHYEVPSQ